MLFKLAAKITLTNVQFKLAKITNFERAFAFIASTHFGRFKQIANTSQTRAPNSVCSSNFNNCLKTYCRNTYIGQSKNGCAAKDVDASSDKTTIIHTYATCNK